MRELLILIQGLSEDEKRKIGVIGAGRHSLLGTIAGVPLSIVQGAGRMLVAGGGQGSEVTTMQGNKVIHRLGGDSNEGLADQWVRFLMSQAERDLEQQLQQQGATSGQLPSSHPTQLVRSLPTGVLRQGDMGSSYSTLPSASGAAAVTTIPNMVSKALHPSTESFPPSRSPLLTSDYEHSIWHASSYHGGKGQHPMLPISNSSGAKGQEPPPHIYGSSSEDFVQGRPAGPIHASNGIQAGSGPVSNVNMYSFSHSQGLQYTGNAHRERISRGGFGETMSEEVSCTVHGTKSEIFREPETLHPSFLTGTLS
jgi:hypothetical protein